jgi:Zn-dependent protease
MLDQAGAIAYTISVWALPALTAITLHEAAHGYVAEQFGDDTARRAGRVSLNPLRHVDPVGTVLLPIVLLLISPLVFGYAKPVPVRFFRLNPRRIGIAAVALAGPAMNLALALLAALLLHLVPSVPVGGRWVADNLVNALWINVLLALLNLLPLLPLDGGRVTHVVSNGDQTETIAAGLAGGESFIAAFSRRDVEPDPPHYTARIAGALTVGGTGGHDGREGCELAIVKVAGGEPPRTSHQHFRYHGMRAGWGYCITTYDGDGSPLPPFAGEPFPLPVAAEPRQAVAELWDLLDRDNRVAAAAKFIDRASGAVRIELINRHDGGGDGA